ncbi:erythromycin esterase family protein [Gracilibacillus oryzae]|uniref:Erythromycin esterase family protein n=1 Tax=Gracilibacillus oryzae TaxID=1672701 RepID=A0A7C8GTT3_9BACI|nr:erythromycin esterase family protein [Gracilibacillus oryzae]KAB8137843.1 erythromycin esterase family protein [Gracilibacillus oryzae]
MRKLLFVLFFIPVLSACSSSVEAVENPAKYISEISELDIPDEVRVIGLGEATHGNSEFQQLKKEVMDALMQNEGVRVFVLEGDFGAGRKINQFILSGKGTAKEAVFSLDYDIYKTQEMIDLVQWMYEHNLEASDDEIIYFYGNDMQRYDASKRNLLEFYQQVAEAKGEQYRRKLSEVSNETLRDLSRDERNKALETLEEIMIDLQTNKQQYTEQTSADHYQFALQYAKVLKQRTNLFLTDNYAQLRDQYLAENLKWIVDYEATRGNDKVLVSGHNGHIEKTSANVAGYQSMGQYLDELYGSEYFAIGTDLLESEFLAKNGSSGDKRGVFRINNNNDLVDSFKDVKENIFYLDFGNASESTKLLMILSSKQKMVNVGDQFSSWYKLMKKFYTIEMIPNEAYDGLIIVKEAKPTELIGEK